MVLIQRPPAVRCVVCFGWIPSERENEGEGLRMASGDASLAIGPLGCLLCRR